MVVVCACFCGRLLPLLALSQVLRLRLRLRLRPQPSRRLRPSVPQLREERAMRPDVDATLRAHEHCVLDVPAGAYPEEVPEPRILYSDATAVGVSGSSR